MMASPRARLWTVITNYILLSTAAFKSSPTFLPANQQGQEESYVSFDSGNDQKALNEEYDPRTKHTFAQSYLDPNSNSIVQDPIIETDFDDIEKEEQLEDENDGNEEFEYDQDDEGDKEETQERDDIDVEEEKDDDEHDDTPRPHGYRTKVKRNTFYHHHYIYHNANQKEADRRHKRKEHDHELKVPTMEKIEKLYHKVDLDKDGIVSKSELASILHIHNRPKHHPQHNDLIETAISRLDLNKDGIIEKEEYLDHMRQSTKEFSDKLMNAEVPRQHLQDYEDFVNTNH